LYAIGVIFNPIKSEEKFYIATVETFKYWKMLACFYRKEPELEPKPHKFFVIQSQRMLDNYCYFCFFYTVHTVCMSSQCTVYGPIHNLYVIPPVNVNDLLLYIFPNQIHPCIMHRAMTSSCYSITPSSKNGFHLLYWIL
jgi:hypothetical protein